MFVLTFTVFNSYSKPESKPKPLSKPSTSKLDTTVLPEPGSDFVSAEAKFFQRKPVEMEIDVQESNLKPSEIARYKKFGPKKPEDETDFRQQGFVVSESQFIQGPYDIQVDRSWKYIILALNYLISYKPYGPESPEDVPKTQGTPRVPPPTPVSTSVESSPIPKRRRLDQYLSFCKTAEFVS